MVTQGFPRHHSWNGSAGYYVGELLFRRRFEHIAECLSQEGAPVDITFIPIDKCVRFSVFGFGPLADVRLHGSECSVYKAMVTLFSDREYIKSLLQENIPTRVHFMHAE